MKQPPAKRQGRPSTVFVNHRGKSTALSRMARARNLSYPMVYKRHIKMGWPLERALTPCTHRRKSNTKLGAQS